VGFNTILLAFEPPPGLPQIPKSAEFGGEEVLDGMKTGPFAQIA
jgi:hypothetical protein